MGRCAATGKIIQELESAFRGARWNVIKVLWGQRVGSNSGARNTEGLLVKRMGEMVDGEYQKLVVSSGDYVRQFFFGSDPRLLKLVEPLPDDTLRRLRLGGHDPRKVYAAYKAAVDYKGGPTVILARTIKGYGWARREKEKTSRTSKKKLNEEELREFRSRFGIPMGDEEIGKSAVLPPGGRQRRGSLFAGAREALGGYVPEPEGAGGGASRAGTRNCSRNFWRAAKGAKFSTTMAFRGHAAARC